MTATVLVLVATIGPLGRHVCGCIAPFLILFDHGVEGDDDLSHDGGEDALLRLSFVWYPRSGINPSPSGCMARIARPAFLTLSSPAFTTP